MAKRFPPWRALPPRPAAILGGMGENLTLILFLAGLAMFVVGDLLWLVRNTFNRPMHIRVTGGLIAAGMLLITIGLVRFGIGGGG